MWDILYLLITTGVMDELIRKLQAHLQDHPDNDDLKDTIACLQTSRKSALPFEATGDTLQKKLVILREQGLEFSRDEELEALRECRATSQPHGGDSNKRSAVEIKSNASSNSPHPSRPNPRLPFSLAAPTALPVELYDLLDQAYRLHVLATDPKSLLPPGKSLLSALSRSHSENAHGASELHDRVEGIVHKAFWDEVGTPF